MDELLLQKFRQAIIGNWQSWQSVAVIYDNVSHNVLLDFTICATPAEEPHCSNQLYPHQKYGRQTDKLVHPAYPKDACLLLLVLRLQDLLPDRRL